MTITAAQALARYGDPARHQAMVLFDVPATLERGHLPGRIYCNKDLVAPLTQALTAIIAGGLVEAVKTWDGCYCLRPMRGAACWSLHAWGLAVDLNAAWNQQGHASTQAPALVTCFEHAGFEWGGRWHRQDPMHFQLATFP